MKAFSNDHGDIACDGAVNHSARRMTLALHFKPAKTKNEAEAQPSHRSSDQIKLAASFPVLPAAYSPQLGSDLLYLSLRFAMG